MEGTKMIPILAAIGVGVLGTLAEKTAAALLKRDLGGRMATDPTGRPFDAILGQSRSVASTQSPLLVAASPRPMGPRVAGDLIGRKVVANGSVVELRGSIATVLPYRLPTTAAAVQIEVRDLHGTVVRTVSLGPRPGGLHQLLFDGRGLPSGQYLYRVIATDAVGQPIAGANTASGRVMGVRLENGRPFLDVGRALVPLSAVYHNQ
ncbi:MAG: hypothetical protein C3F12_12150 [Candidatus Methylomirabilota bacterium]|nr:hypothetical protein [Candidatus Methylomirabilis sp.]NJD68877.1 hypothetical protein [candidate division NC10 bacterium]PWB43983.1 MAG: hypothetical protein C3F12_12150 [candidate division NC10 bacterium]